MNTFKQAIEREYDEKIEDLVYLKNLDLTFYDISDLSGIEKLVNLEELDLRNNRISDLKPLKNLVNLKKLYLASNDISDLSGIEKLVNLKTLYLLRNPIKNSKSSFKNPRTDKIVYFNKKHNLYSCGCFCNKTPVEFKEKCLDENFTAVIKHFNL